MQSIHIALVNFTSHNACLCAKHRSFALKLQALESTGAKICVNLETVANHSQEDNTSSLELLTSDSITYAVYKIVFVLVKKGNKMLWWRRWKLLTLKCKKKTIWLKELIEFEKHVEKIRKQHSKIMHLKTLLPETHVFVQMDFTEDFKLTTRRNSVNVLERHARNNSPTMIYYNQEGCLVHQSVVYISNEPRCNASAVSNNEEVGTFHQIAITWNKIYLLFDRFTNFKVSE